MASPAPIPIICGPTGSGKTGAAVRLAASYPIEIVSADSRQIIRHLDIGTAKPTSQEREAVAMHLLDLIEPGQRYTAFRFIDDATAAINDIFARNKLPVVVGGTGLYLRALTDGIVEIEEEDMSLRDALEREMEQLGPAAMYEQLERIDPLEAARTHPNNRVRVLRALEIYRRTGRTRSELAETGHYRRSGFDFTAFCLAPPRDELYARINDRVDAMMTGGFLEEVRRLAGEGRSDAVRRANVLGYVELLDHFEGKYSLAEAVALIKQHHRRYAKRQLTWFRNQTAARFYENSDRLTEAVAVALDGFRPDRTE